ncbi:MAG: hypothetical protein ACPLRW_06790 [Moorellales bacterium]
MARRPKAPWVPEVEPEGLSPQQKRIWNLAKQGLTAAEIARRIGATEEVVKKQLKRIRIKGTEDVNKNCQQVSYAHRPEEELDEDLAEIISSEHLSLQHKVKLLNETGRLSMRAMAEHLGTSYGAVRVMRWRLQREAKRTRTVKRRLAAEEMAALPGRPAEEPAVVRSMAYEVYVIHADSVSPAAQAARRLLAALGGGGPQIRQLAFSDRAQILKRLLAERKGLMKLLGKNVYWLVRDVLEQEFVPMADGVLRPRRGLSWEALRAVLRERFEAIVRVSLATDKVWLGRVGEREGLPVYEFDFSGYGPVAAAVRQIGQAYLVARADRLESSAERIAAGRLERWEPAEGRAVLLTETGRVTVECGGVAVRHRGSLWTVSDLRLAQPGDAVEVAGTHLVVRSRDLRLVVLSREEAARLAAWAMVGKDCFVRVWEPAADGGDSWREFRCALPGVEKIMLVDVNSLDWEEAARRERAELEEFERGPEGGRAGRSDPRSRPVRVKPQEDRSRYRVVAGALRVAEAVERGINEVLAVAELPQR